MEEVANPIAKASFDRVEPAVEKMCRLGFRLRQARRRAIARHGVISAGVPTPESLVGPSWRLRRLQFPTTPATAPNLPPGLVSSAGVSLTGWSQQGNDTISSLRLRSLRKQEMIIPLRIAVGTDQVKIGEVSLLLSDSEGS